MRQQQGLPLIVPKVVPVKPYDDLRWVMTGFWRLSNSRPQGFNGPLRIPISEIESYCRLSDYKLSKRQEFLHYITQMDEVYMAFVKLGIEKQERESKLKNQKAPKR